MNTSKLLNATLKIIIVLSLLMIGEIMALGLIAAIDSVTNQTMPATITPMQVVENSVTVISTEHWELIINGSERPLELRVDNTLDSIGCDASTNKDNIGKYCILINKEEIISFMDSMGVYITQ